MSQPKETIQALDYEEFCGGKGLNQSVALAGQARRYTMPEPVGGDGRILLDMLKEAGADTGYVETLDGASGHAVIQIDESGQNNIIICGGTNRKIHQRILSSVLEHFGKGDLILLQNEISNIDFAMEEAKNGDSRWRLTHLRQTRACSSAIWSWWIILSSMRWRGGSWQEPIPRNRLRSLGP